MSYTNETYTSLKNSNTAYEYVPALKCSCARIINHITPAMYNKTHNLL
jgi:hypothetical protein